MPDKAEHAKLAGALAVPANAPVTTTAAKPAPVAAPKVADGGGAGGAEIDGDKYSF